MPGTAVEKSFSPPTYLYVRHQIHLPAAALTHSSSFCAIKAQYTSRSAFFRSSRALFSIVACLKHGLSRVIRDPRYCRIHISPFDYILTEMILEVRFQIFVKVLSEFRIPITFLWSDRSERMSLCHYAVKIQTTSYNQKLSSSLSNPASLRQFCTSPFAWFQQFKSAVKGLSKIL